MTGIVYKSTGSWYTVKSTNGDFIECRIKGKFRIKGIKSTNPIAVGDVIDYELEETSDTTTGTIHAIHDRKNYIVRKSVNLSHQMHIIAANFFFLHIDNPESFDSGGIYNTGTKRQIIHLSESSSVLSLFTGLRNDFCLKL